MSNGYTWYDADVRRLSPAPVGGRKISTDRSVRDGVTPALRCTCFVPDTQVSRGSGGFWRFRSGLNP
jgi:hypothetical protein